jgi:hypothetical protein
MITFREQALAIFSKQAQEQAEWNAKKALEFAEQATDRLLVHDWPFQAVGPDEAKLEVEGLTIVARRRYGIPSFYMMVQCSKCESYGEVEVLDLAGVGEAIQSQDTHLCPECRNPNTGYVVSWQERLVDALMEGLEEKQRSDSEDYYTL